MSVITDIRCVLTRKHLILFDEGGSGNQIEQGDSTGGGQDANILPVVEVMAPVQPRWQGKRKYVVVDAGGASHPPKKLRDDHGTLSGTSVGGKSQSLLQRLLAGAVLNVEVGVTTIPTLPFVIDSVSTTPENEGRDHTDSVAELNLCTIGTPRRFVISSDSCHHSGTNVAEAEVDSLVRSSVLIMTTVTTITSTIGPTFVTKEKHVKPFLFGAGSSSASGTDPTTGVFSDLTSSDFLVGVIRTVINPDSDLQKVYVPQWSVTNGSQLDDGRICREMVDEFAPPKFFVSVRRMEHDQLFTEFNVRAARQMSLSVEAELLKVREGETEDLKARLSLKEAEAAEAIRLRAEASNFETVEKSLQDETNALKERNVILEKLRNDLDGKVPELETSAAGKERELTDLNSLVTSVKSQNDNLVDQVLELELSSSGLQEKVTVYENCMEQLEKFQDDRMKVVNDKFDKMYTDFVEMALHLEEKFYPHLLTTISSRIWLLTQGMELAIIKCLNSPEYLSALRAAIDKAIEKDIHDGLSAGITHGKEGKVLTDVADYNPSAEVDYLFALQQLQNVNFPLLAKLRSNKDASIEAVMNILRLEEPLMDKLGLDELQPNLDQLMVPIYHSPNKVVIGATALSLALDVSNIRVRKIKENIANHRSALHDVFVPLFKPLSAAVLTGTEGTSDVVSAIGDTTTALSITFASASMIAPISVDDYEIIGAESQAAADGNAASFPNVDDAELNII
ncbi:hypothetical protein Tco_0878596 [Tanacetum coccineum]|uniref:Transposase (Putative), gypsy type n=1 Tax=Tanacetum coccineum TaxID=301880 RepID=A0ABQ5BYA5_9ASTR